MEDHVGQNEPLYTLDDSEPPLESLLMPQEPEQPQPSVSMQIGAYPEGEDLGGDADSWSDDEVIWVESLGQVAENSMDVAPEVSEPERNSEKVNDDMLQKLLTGKTVEAFSWFAGSKGVTYTMYLRLTAGFNFYIDQLGQSRYLSYGTVLYNVLDIMNQAVLVRKCRVETVVNTQRAGVAQTRLLRNWRSQAKDDFCSYSSERLGRIRLPTIRPFSTAITTSNASSCYHRHRERTNDTSSCTPQNTFHRLRAHTKHEWI